MQLSDTHFFRHMETFSAMVNPFLFSAMDTDAMHKIGFHFAIGFHIAIVTAFLYFHLAQWRPWNLLVGRLNINLSSYNLY